MIGACCGPSSCRRWPSWRAVSCEPPPTEIPPRKLAMKWRIVVIAALGAALALYLVAFVGIGAVFSAAFAAGWGGFAILCLYTVALFPILGVAWRALLPGAG